MSWRERLIREPGLTDIAQWPVIERSSLPPKYRSEFLTNQKLVARVLSGVPCYQVAHEFGCSKGRISQLMNRALGGDLAEPAALTRALIPNHRLEPPTRREPLPRLEAPRGATGAFASLLSQLPTVKTALDAAILADAQRTSRSQRLQPSALHHTFLRLLTEAGWPVNRYPHTTLSRGYESLRRYLERMRIGLKTPARRRERITELEQGLSRSRALATVQIDEHLMHLHGGLAIQFNDELIELRVERCSLLLAVDVSTQCILGFVLRPTQHPNQDDLLALFDQCLSPTQAPEIVTPGFDSLAVPAFPTEVSPWWPLTWGTVQLDNAWIHHSNAVTEFLCNTLGATISWGLPAQPKTRWLVEQVFDYIEKKTGHRFDSTTGSHPKDPQRESARNAKKVPALSFQSLLEALYLVIGVHNNTPKPHLAGASPMALFQHHLHHHWIRWPTEGLGVRWQPFQSTLTLPVHRPKKEKRAPYLNFCYCRYSGDGLLSITPEETHVVVHCDRRDIRYLTAYTPLGRSLGQLSAPKSWCRFPHSQATRRLLFKKKRASSHDGTDPITGYFLEMLGQKRTPRIAAHILKLYLEISPQGQHRLAVGEEADSADVFDGLASAESRSERNTRTHFTWSPTVVSKTGRLE